MKRLWRRLFNFSAGVSLILLLGTGVLWVYNLQHGLGVYYTGQDTPAMFVAYRNLMSFRSYDDVYVPPPIAPGWSAGTSRYRDQREAMALWAEVKLSDHALAKLGIAYRQGVTGPPIRARVGSGSVPWRWKYGNRTVHMMYAPHWVIALHNAVLPTMWLAARLRARSRFMKGLCPVCGYDLRATPDRCPECGTVPPKAQP